MSPADLLATALVTANLGSTAPSTSWPVFVGNMPDETDADGLTVPFAECICVRDIGGTMQGRLMEGRSIVKPGVQIRVRSHTREAGYDKAEQIFTWADAVLRLVVGDRTVQAISMNSNILYLGRAPDSLLDEHAVNAILTILPLEIV
jgi:hypothetical protein